MVELLVMMGYNFVIIFKSLNILFFFFCFKVIKNILFDILFLFLFFREDFLGSDSIGLFFYYRLIFL